MGIYNSNCSKYFYLFTMPNQTLLKNIIVQSADIAATFPPICSTPNSNLNILKNTFYFMFRLLFRSSFDITHDT